MDMEKLEAYSSDVLNILVKIQIQYFHGIFDHIIFVMKNVNNR